MWFPNIIIQTLLVCSLIQVGLSGSAYCVDDDGNAQKYDSGFRICCGGALAQRTTDIACCDGKLYYSDIQICCNGQVSKKYVPRSTKKWEAKCDDDKSDCDEMKCCGNKLFPEPFLCCDGAPYYLTVSEVVNKDNLHCCGKGRIFNPYSGSEMCCGGEVFYDPRLGCCNESIYNKGKEVCIGDSRLERNKGLCDGSAYNKRDHMCCGDELTRNVPEIIQVGNNRFQNNPNAKCCGSLVITSNKTCCEDYGYPAHSIPKLPDLLCCGSGYYNASSQFCIRGIARDRSPHEDLCGELIIDRRNESCCANKLRYDFKTEQCCEGASYCVIGKDEKCCNGLLMKSNEVCCENIKPCKKQNWEDDECCYDFETDSAQTYKKGIKTCSKGELRLNKEGYSFCGNENYKEDSHFCCSRKIYEHSSGQCCNGVFNSIPKSEGRCCIHDNKAYEFKDEKNPCIKECKNKTYDESFELCCGGNVYNFTGNNYCCGLKAVDPNVQGCCGDQFPYRKGGRKRCCRNSQLYDRKYTKCNAHGELESRKTLKGLTDVEKVCQPLAVKVFDGAIQRACKSTYTISGRIRSQDVRKLALDRGEHLIRMTVRNVEIINKSTSTAKPFPKKITFNIHIGSNECQVDHLKQLTRVIVLFDDKLHGNYVEIFNDSHFFINRRTYRGQYYIREAFSRHLCKMFWNL